MFWKIFIIFLLMLKNDSIFKMSWFFFFEDLYCRFVLGKEDIIIVLVKLCVNNIFDYLFVFGVSGKM